MYMNWASFNCKYDEISRWLYSDVNIAACSSQTKYKREWKAMWDTGASRSVISSNVVRALHLKPVTKMTAHTPSSSAVTFGYYIDLYLPNNLKIDNLLVMEADPYGCDMLIGMDVITKGDLMVNNSDGKTSFTFRVSIPDEIK